MQENIISVVNSLKLYVPVIRYIHGNTAATSASPNLGTKESSCVCVNRYALTS